MHVSSSTTLRADSTTGVEGTVVNGEDQFGLDKSDYEPKFEVMVRAGTRNRLWLNYFTLDRDGSTVVQEPIVFRNVVLQPGEPLQSSLDLRLLSLTYGYSFWHGEKLELAATLGVSSVEINAQAKVATALVHVNETETAAGPFPTPGLAATWAMSKHFYLDGRVQYLNLHISDLDGSLGMGELDLGLSRSAKRLVRPRLHRDQGARLSTKTPTPGSSTSTPRGRSSSSASRSNRRRGGRPHEAGSTLYSTRLLADAARFHSPAVSVSLCGG